MPDEDKIKKVAGLLSKAKSVFVVTGAGISADSGLPTYRGIGGLYNDAVTDEGIPIETALAGETIATQPEITWKYLGEIEKKCRGAKFNRAHEVLALMEKRFERTWVLTQNIDGLHRAAGSKNVIEIHGDFHKLLCPACGWKATLQDYSKIDIPPLCPRCEKIVRPEVVFFGEQLPSDALSLLYEQLRKGFDIYFSIGTTSVFPYIQEPVVLARQSGKPTIEINPSETQISHLVDIKLPMGAAEALGLIWQEFSLVTPS